MVDDIGAHVTAIEPGLAWELGPGRRSQHSLTLSPEGRLDLRRLTERWVRSAPVPDNTWEYYPARQPSERLSLRIGGHEIRVDGWRFVTELDEAYGRVSVAAYHAGLEGLSKNQRLQALFLSVDQLLGEDGVQTWLDRIDLLDQPPTAAASPQELRQLVQDRSRSWKEEKWLIGNGKDALGRPLFLMYNQRLKPLEHLFAETLIRVDLILRQPNEHGLTVQVEADQLNPMEEELLRAAPQVISIGRMTGRGQRNIFFYAVDGRAVLEAFQDVLKAYPEWRPQMSSQPDPNWEFLHQGMFEPFVS